jgi:hypothetical protein
MSFAALRGAATTIQTAESAPGVAAMTSFDPIEAVSLYGSRCYDPTVRFRPNIGRN